MGTHDENQHEHGQVREQYGAPSTSVVSEEIRFRVQVKWPFLDEIGPGEVANQKKEKKQMLAI